MDSKIVEMLHLSLEPIGIFFGSTEAKSDLEASPDKRNCIIPFEKENHKLQVFDHGYITSKNRYARL